MAWDDLLDKYSVSQKKYSKQDEKTLRSSYNIQKKFNDTRKNKVFQRILDSLEEDEKQISKSNIFISEILSQPPQSPQKNQTLNGSQISSYSPTKSQGLKSRQYNRSKSKNQEALKQVEKDGYFTTNNTLNENFQTQENQSEQQLETNSQQLLQSSQSINAKQRFFTKMFISQSIGMSYKDIEALALKQDDMFQSYLKSSNMTDQEQQFQNKHNFGSLNQVLTKTNQSIEEDEQHENESEQQQINIENFLEATNKVYFVNQKRNDISHLEKTANF